MPERPGCHWRESRPAGRDLNDRPDGEDRETCNAKPRRTARGAAHQAQDYSMSAGGPKSNMSKGKVEAMPRTSSQKSPKLRRLKYGHPYCELCRDRLGPGDLVAWWRVPAGGGNRSAVYCRTCHQENVRRGVVLR
jgi:hypothetical protein